MVIVAATICLVVANIGLSQLIALSIPILMAVYPVAIALVMLTLVANRLKNPRLTYAVTLSVAFVFGIFDGFSAAGLELVLLHAVPMFDEGLAWVLPTLLAFFLTAGKPVRSAVGDISTSEA
ncbi:branched-chain amino acid transport system II carrier protein [Alkalimarinus sediminis]|uniref:Branched-chain amino acid transport system carrier protein n=1 Tax=Alkalimarinus sediminis TaxID=1632866 RepID=A0A9E8HHP7_9ALTE|nr:branched-chain amino acid transport system II carrier protein [Alkalimarinus sediminis]UZW74619.1 branched-chain amino acid transport system II carrier protein [Alkalimarinus sediminis]